MDYRYQQLEQYLLKGIQTQRWRSGERLPSIRQLCLDHQVSKATAIHALQRLEAQGLLEARPKAGYFVTYQFKAATGGGLRRSVDPPRLVTETDLLLDIMRRSAAFDLLPGAATSPTPPGIVAMNRSIARSLRRQEGAGFQYYDEPAGDRTLREQLAIHYARRGWQPEPDQFCITTGCQNALFLALLASCQKGDIVAVETPGFYGVLQLLQQLELKVLEVPASPETGIDVDLLQNVLSCWPVRACIVSPAFATPGGAVMPLPAKQKLLALAKRFDLVVIEDDIYADTAFNHPPEPLKALDTDDRVILCSSFSKSVSRDIRLGWISGGRWQERILYLKLVTQLASSRYLQQGFADFMAEGHFVSHLRRQRNQLRENRDFLLAVLHQWEMPVKVSAPAGGLAVWVELPESMDTLKSYRAALPDNIVLTPGSLFSVSGQFNHCLRISFAHRWDAKRFEALNRLPKILMNA